MAATGPRLAGGYWPGYFRPQVSLGVLAWLLQASGWPGDTGVAATGPKLAWGYWPGCCMPRVCLGIQAWLIQATGWPGVLALLLQPTG